MSRADKRNYGFILTWPDEEKIFFREANVRVPNEAATSGVALTVDDFVEFRVVVEPTIGKVAHDVAWQPVERLDDDVPHMFRDEVLRCEEDRETEFKSMANSSAITFRTKTICSKYLNAFLNTDGGTLYLGIEDTGIVKGLRLDRQVRDDVRLVVDNVMQHSMPSVPPQLYSVEFVPVYHRRAFGGVAVDQCFVVRIRVKKGSSVYETQDHERWLRRDGSVMRMSMDMVEKRFQAHKANVGASPEELFKLFQQYMETHGKGDASSAAAATAANTPIPLETDGGPVLEGVAGEKIQIDDNEVSNLVNMGFKRGAILDALYTLQKEGYSEPNPYNIVLDRLTRQSSEDSDRPPPAPQETVAPVESTATAASAAPREKLSAASEQDKVPCEFCQLDVPWNAYAAHVKECQQSH